MKTFGRWIVGCMAAAALFAAGCNSQEQAPPSTPATPTTDAGHDDHAHDHDHDHPSTGPHGGDLVELGNEQYHAEILHEDKALVYVLDGSAKSAAPIAASELVINVAHDGKSEQFRLAADPDAQDPEGKSSRFSSDDGELLSDLKSGDARVELVVDIDGKQYRGKLEHSHDHDHDH